MKGNSVLEYNSRLSHYSGTIPMNVSVSTLLDLNYVINQTDKLAKNINVTNIHKSNMSKQLLQKYDSITVEQWLNSTLTDKEAIEQYKAAIRGIVYAEPSQLSFLFWLNYVKSANGSAMHLVETKNGAQDSKIIGGAQSVCNSMLKYIGFDAVKLQHCVTKIEQSNKDYIAVHCSNHTTFKCKHLLCSIPPALYSKIEWKPQLSVQRMKIGRNMAMAYILKTNVFYKTAFWRTDGLNGLSFCCGEKQNNNSPIIVTFDDCKPDGSVPSLMGLTLNRSKYMNMSAEQRKQSVLEQYCRIFKNKKAITECIGYFEKIWSTEEYSLGGPVGVTKCNVLSSEYWKVLKQNRNGQIFFCGTELADQWMGYIDGAIQCGEKEAHKIAQILANNDESVIVKSIFEYDKEPECDGCPLPFVNLQRSWIERNLLPSAKNAKSAVWISLFFIFLCFAVKFA